MWFCSDEHLTFAPHGPLRVGDRIRVLPAHVDPTVAYHEHLYVVDGDEVVGSLGRRPARAGDPNT